MKGWKKRILALLLILAAVAIELPVTAKAAGTPAPTVTKKTLYVGYESYTIKMKNLAKDSKVTYATSDKKVVTVTNKGVMKPVAVGKATVTVTVTQSKKTYKSSIAVTVKNPSVWISNKITTLSAGESYQFTGKTYGLSKEKISLTWTSSKPKVATIDAKTGKMKAIAKGTTTITLKDRTSGKKSTCQVTVTAAKVDKEAWLSAYRAKMEDIYSEFCEYILFYDEEKRSVTCDYSFIYLDEDDIPECVVKLRAWDSEELVLLHYRDGNVDKSVWGGHDFGVCISGYMPRSSMFLTQQIGRGYNIISLEKIDTNDPGFNQIATYQYDDFYDVVRCWIGEKTVSESECKKYMEKNGIIIKYKSGSPEFNKDTWIEGNGLVFPTMEEAYDHLINVNVENKE